MPGGPRKAMAAHVKRSVSGEQWQRLLERAGKA
jgi:hypothetical protein